jgi:pheromone alpha factor receptor
MATSTLATDASSMTAAPSMAPTTFDPFTQNITITLADGVTQILTPLDAIDTFQNSLLATSLAEGTQISACIMMLAVVLTMTPRNRFARIPTRVNIGLLFVTFLHSLSFGLYFTSHFVEFYVFYTQDLTTVPTSDYAVQVLSSLMTAIQQCLILAALGLQAWSMIQLWPVISKWAVIGLSVPLSILNIGFRCAKVGFDVRNIIGNFTWPGTYWVQYCDNVISVVAICWFCSLFILRLLIHMVKNRSFLPSVKGLTPMEVLVMTNGVLMLIPGKPSTSSLRQSFTISNHQSLTRSRFVVFFAGLQWETDNWAFWQPNEFVGSSVALVLPLGVLIAQRISTPSDFTFSASSENSSGTEGTAVNSRYRRGRGIPKKFGFGFNKDVSSRGEEWKYCRRCRCGEQRRRCAGQDRLDCQAELSEGLVGWQQQQRQWSSHAGTGGGRDAPAGQEDLCWTPGWTRCYDHPCQGRCCFWCRGRRPDGQSEAGAH